ncbi:leucine-rich repeat extensin-like protein 3 isoform X1 [Aquila chrysaetos chrysaetos]|uniref:leucine-rich repeat extensin-like protein 3 isoform X1 n=1 Tax=Aquila chrysaetos chrysaetos TaxID=223781 RepID=UPI001176B3A9|nr:leucine-rich repeat extensin-like protein 3 isoform X1 [Aquila chrysaetos chrysaetos]
MSHPFHPHSWMPHVPSFLLVILHPQLHSFLPSCALPLPTMFHPSLFSSFITHLTQPRPPFCAPPSPTHPIPPSLAPSPTISHPFSCVPPSFMSHPSFCCSSIVYPSHPSFLCSCHPLCPIPPCHPLPSPTTSHPSFLCSCILHHVLSLLELHCHPPPLIPPCSLPPLHIPSLLPHSFQNVLSSTVSHPSLPCHAPPLPTMSPPALLCSCILYCILSLLIVLHHPPHPIPSSCALPSSTTSHPSFLCSSIALHIPPSCLPVTLASHPSHLLLLHPPCPICYPHPPPTISACLLSPPPPCPIHPHPALPPVALFLSYPSLCQNLTIPSDPPSAPTIVLSSCTSYHLLIHAYPPLVPTITPICFNILHFSSSPHLSSSSSTSSCLLIALTLLHFPIPKSTLTSHHCSIPPAANIAQSRLLLLHPHISNPLLVFLHFPPSPHPSSSIAP